MEIKVKVWIEDENKNLIFGSGKTEILRQIEQTGSIFMECEEGHLHCSIYSDIDILNESLEIVDKNQSGLVKLYSVLPYSYPGHIILTEDSGEILGEDDCPCGRKGKYFKLTGRIKQAELRGCSDTYAAKF